MAYFVIMAELVASPEDHKAQSGPHRAYVDMLTEKGHFVTGGPIDGGPRRVRIFRGDSKSQVEQLVQQDPFYLAGLLRNVEVHEWTINDFARGRLDKLMDG